jgi:hypothetical protein
MVLQKKMKNIKYHTVETVPTSNKNRSKTTLFAHIYMNSHFSGLVHVHTLQRVGVKEKK